MDENKADLWASAAMEAFTDGLYDGTVKEFVEKTYTCKGLQYHVKRQPNTKHAVCWIGDGVEDVHWIYVDELGIEHNSYTYGMQRAGGQQFCQTYAVLMAVDPSFRVQVQDSTTPIHRVFDFWKAYFTYAGPSRRLRYQLRKLQPYLNIPQIIQPPKDIAELCAFLSQPSILAYLITW